MADTATISVAVIFSVGAAAGIVTVIGVFCCGKNKPKCCGDADKVNPIPNNNQAVEKNDDDNKESQKNKQKNKNNTQKKKTKKERKRERQEEEAKKNQHQPKKENKKPPPKKAAHDNFYDEDYDGEPLDVFISYRRVTGSALASLLKAHLSGKGFTCFIDVDKLEAGQFDTNLLSNVKRAKNFVLVLSEGALDKCVGDLEMKDWVHVKSQTRILNSDIGSLITYLTIQNHFISEIATAIACKKAIIPVIDVKTFKWPNPNDLPEDMRTIQMYNGVRWVHDYQEACIDKVVRFLSGLDPGDDDEEAVPGSIRRLFR